MDNITLLLQANIFVEQDALMPPNLCRRLEEPAVVSVREV